MDKVETIIDNLIELACELTIENQINTEKEIRSFIKGIIDHEYKAQPEVTPEQRKKFAEALSYAVIKLRFGKKQKTYNQKFHVGQNVYFFDHRIDENGIALRDEYVIRNGIITGLTLQMHHQLKSNKRFNGKDFVGPADEIRIFPNDITSFESYTLINKTYPARPAELYASLEEAKQAAAEMKERYPEVKVTQQIENFKVTIA